MRDFLIKGAEELGIALDKTAVDRLFMYKDFLVEYNEKVSLTSIVDDEGIIVKHFLDSLTLLPELEINAGTRLIDIGTGAGFPGVVLKIANGDLDLVLMDSLNKRIKFLEQLVDMLGLAGVRCIHGRAEEMLHRPEYREKFDYATARAVTGLSKLSGYCLPYVKVGGMFVAMKGPNYHEEMDEARDTIKRLGGEVLEAKEIKLPKSDTTITRCLIKVRKIVANPKKKSR